MKETKCDKCKMSEDVLILYPVSIDGIGQLHVCRKCFQEVEEIQKRYASLLNSSLLAWYMEKTKGSREK